MVGFRVLTLVKYMAKRKTLKELNLCMNDIGAAGITEVCPYTLDLNPNPKPYA